MTPRRNRPLGRKRRRKKSVLQLPDFLSGLGRDTLRLCLAGLVQTAGKLGLSFVKQGMK